MLQRGSCREIVLVNHTCERTAGAVTDMGYGRPLLPPVDLIAGDYEDLAGTDLVIITVGANEQSGGATDRDDATGPPPAAGPKCGRLPRCRPPDRRARPRRGPLGGDRSAGPLT